MSQNINREDVRTFLKSNVVATLSTVDDLGLPCAAAIYYLVDDDFTFWFVAPEKTQKIRNILKQNQVALTVTDEKTSTTAQVKGRAYQSDVSLHDIMTRFATQLNDDFEFVLNLPILQHKKQEKIVMRIQPGAIRLREYHGSELVEQRIVFDD